MKRAALALIPALLAGWLIVAIVLEQRHAHLTASLVQAVNRSDPAEVESLLAQGADPNARDWKTYYPGYGKPYRPPWYEKYLAKLMRRQPRAADPYVGPTVLMIAAYRGNIRIVQRLLDYGAKPAKLGTELNSNAAPDSACASALWEAIKNRNSAAKADEFGIARLLLEHGANVNFQTNGGATVLMVAAARGETGIVKMLTVRGADINIHDQRGNSALMYAVMARDIASMSLLLSHGADVNSQNQEGLTPLMEASYSGFGPCLPSHGQWRSSIRDAMQKLLRDHGADPRLKDCDGHTAVDYEHLIDPKQACGP